MEARDGWTWSQEEEAVHETFIDSGVVRFRDDLFVRS